jgi:hypothetical protein
VASAVTACWPLPPTPPPAGSSRRCCRAGPPPPPCSAGGAPPWRRWRPAWWRAWLLWRPSGSRRCPQPAWSRTSPPGSWRRRCSRAAPQSGSCWRCASIATRCCRKRGLYLPHLTPPHAPPPLRHRRRPRAPRATPLRSLRAAVRPHMAHVKLVLEQRHALARRRTLFEYADILLAAGQWYIWGLALALRTASDSLSWLTRWAAAGGGARAPACQAQCAGSSAPGRPQFARHPPVAGSRCHGTYPCSCASCLRSTSLAPCLPPLAGTVQGAVHPGRHAQLHGGAGHRHLIPVCRHGAAGAAAEQRRQPAGARQHGAGLGARRHRGGARRSGRQPGLRLGRPQVRGRGIRRCAGCRGCPSLLSRGSGCALLQGMPLRKPAAAQR